MQHPLSAKIGTNFPNMWRSLGRIVRLRTKATEFSLGQHLPGHHYHTRPHLRQNPRRRGDKAAIRVKGNWFKSEASPVFPQDELILILDGFASCKNVCT
jgi:hypothetical protein